MMDDQGGNQVTKSQFELTIHVSSEEAEALCGRLRLPGSGEILADIANRLAEASVVALDGDSPVRGDHPGDDRGLRLECARIARGDSLEARRLYDWVRGS